MMNEKTIKHRDTETQRLHRENQEKIFPDYQRISVILSAGSSCGAAASGSLGERFLYFSWIEQRFSES
jgi:hypothetical protein